VRHTQNDKLFFAQRVVWVGHLQSQWVTEYGRCLLKGYLKRLDHEDGSLSYQKSNLALAKGFLNPARFPR